ncbi:MAG: HlyD family efflux transporter periplasmic adaptor subunit [Planctomycetaceae bacterium]
MSSTIETKPATTAAPERLVRDSDTFSALAALVHRHPTAHAFYRDAIALIGEHFQSPYAAAQVRSGTLSLDECTESTSDGAILWSRVTQAALLEAESKWQAIARLYNIDGNQTSVAVLAVPIKQNADGASGGVALVAACEDKQGAETLLFELRTLAAIVSAIGPKLTATAEPEVSVDLDVARALTKASEYRGLEELAFALTNSVKTKFSCDQVALGFVRGKTIRIVSISELDGLYPRSPGTNQIRQAMEECLDSRETISMSAVAGWTTDASSADFRLHLQWSAAIGSASVASIPLLVDDVCVAVLSLTRPKGVAFDSAELKKIATALQGYARALTMLARSGRSLPAHAADSLRAAIKWVAAPGRVKRRVLAALAVAVGLWFIFGDIPYRVSVPCTITANQLQNFTAPFHGAIAAAYVEPGDQVQQGQLLFKMDTQALELQSAEYESEAAVAQLQATQAVAAQDLDTAAKATATLHVLQARLEVVEQQIRMAHAVAPSDGTIMSGEITKRVGEVVPMGETLIQFAPHDAWRVELKTPENQVLDVHAGLRGRFSTLARPDDPVSFTLERVNPAADLKDGNNVFLATATVDRNPSWMRAGMQGVATVDAGDRRVWWVSLHRWIDFTRFHWGS